MVDKHREGYWKERWDKQKNNPELLEEKRRVQRRHRRKQREDNPAYEWLKMKHRNYKYYDTKVKPKTDGIYDYTLEELMMVFATNKCIYCGSTENLTLDRIDNDKGHSKTNTVVACIMCNQVRNTHFTVEEMEVIGKTIREVLDKRCDNK